MTNQTSQSYRPPKKSQNKSGLAARQAALRLIHAVLSEGRLLDDAYKSEIKDGPLRKLNGADRSFARRIAITVLQHLGEIDHVLAAFMERGLPKKSGPLRNILRIGTAELLFLKVPAHAVVDSAVSHYRTWRKYAGFKGLTNAVLRRISQEGQEVLANIDTAQTNLPNWLYDSWCQSYGKPAVDSFVAIAHQPSIPLDLYARGGNAKEWAEKLGGSLTPTGSIRLTTHERVDLMEGYAEGAWWVQDAAASLPALMLGDVDSLKVLDLCAAPGGKCLQLAAKGANVTALDLSAQRLERLKDNLDRTGLKAELIASDLFKFKPEQQWPAILLDAPCSATGTIRRHPELVHQRSPRDIAHFAKLQKKMLKKVADWVAPGGLLVFCTCSLEPQEGPDLVADFLMQNPDFCIEPLKASEIAGIEPFIQPDGSLRTRSDLWQDIGGMDGFYAIRFRRNADPDGE